MSERKMINCMISGLGAGLIGGSLGLGGAIILVPVWLNLGMDQMRASSSSPPLIFFSAAMNFIICLISGKYDNFISVCLFFAIAYAGSTIVKGK